MLRFDDAPSSGLVATTQPGESTATLRSRLITAWLDAQAASYEIEDYERLGAATEARLVAADHWFAEHDQADPQYQDAIQLRGQLMSEQRAIRATYGCLLMRCWTACTATYVLLESLPRAHARVWVHQHIHTPQHLHRQTDEEKGEIDHPIELWRLLLGQRPVPGSFPHEVRDRWTDRARHVEYWHCDELHKRVAELRGTDQ